MATTRTPFNWRVPEGIDFLKQGWDAIQDLADDIAATFAARATVICTSATRPSAPTDGLKIWETDTKAFGHWDASANAGAGVWRMFDTQWQTYTPTLSTGFSPGTTGAVNTGRYQRRGRYVHLDIQMVIGTAGATGGSGTWTWSLPSGLGADTSTTGWEHIFHVKAWHTSIGNVVGYGIINNGGSTISVGLPQSGTSSVQVMATGTVPGAWAAGNNVHISGDYELAA